jgi:hypothetical protein
MHRASTREKIRVQGAQLFASFEGKGKPKGKGLLVTFGQIEEVSNETRCIRPSMNRFASRIVHFDISGFTELHRDLHGRIEPRILPSKSAGMIHKVMRPRRVLLCAGGPSENVRITEVRSI